MEAARATERFDALIVGAGPAGLSAAIRLKQLCRSAGRDMRVGVVEKGPAVGAHVLSGCVLDPVALDELLPQWRDAPDAPRATRVTRHAFQILTGARTPCVPLPRPPPMKQRSAARAGGDTFVLSLGDLCAWMGARAEALGVEVLPGFGADSVLLEGGDGDGKGGAVAGVATKDVGVGRDGRRKAGFQRGVELRAPFTLFAEGCKGHLTERVIERFALRPPGVHQTYALGLKEVWRVRPDRHRPGLVSHSVGWPADGSTYAGSFEYHAHDNLVYLGYAVGLDYVNPHLDPFSEFQKLKTARSIARTLEGGECLQFGARTMTEGGVQAVPKLTFPGGAIAGCGAGFMNVSRLKGAHTAMQSGIYAAEAAFASALRGEPGNVDEYERRIRSSWVWKECYRFRNMRPSFRTLGLAPQHGGHGLLPFLGFSALDAYVLRGKLPVTFSLGKLEDHQYTMPACMSKPKTYAPPDGKTTFDRTKALSLTGVGHIEDQPSHLVLQDKDAPLRVNHQLFAGMDQRYCPAGVYEYYEDEDGKTKFKLNPANCLHCKTCEIKDPTQNVQWTLPQGPGGPSYSGM